MMYWRKALICFLLLTVAACSSTEPKTETPLDTLKAYAVAYKKKDYTTMKLLLSESTIKMHQQAAKDRGVTLDDIVERETLIKPDQTNYDYRNQKIDGDRAALELKNSFGVWDTVNFVREEGIWKIDKQSFADQTIQQIDEDNKKLDELINQGKQP